MELVWDPGIYFLVAKSIGQSGVRNRRTFAFTSWLTRRQRNKLNHILTGNRGQRGNGINITYWNKGPSFLSHKQQDIETIIATHKPLILGLGGAIGVAYQGINTLISRELSEGQWHQVLTFISDTGIDINLELIYLYLMI